MVFPLFTVISAAPDVEFLVAFNAPSATENVKVAVLYELMSVVLASSKSRIKSVP